MVMASNARLRKDTDYETRFRCSAGIGILREEVWVDPDGEVIRYNLAFLLPHRFRPDNGRILGFDNAHDFHERHFMGISALASAGEKQGGLSRAMSKLKSGPSKSSSIRRGEKCTWSSAAFMAKRSART